MKNKRKKIGAFIRVSHYKNLERDLRILTSFQITNDIKEIDHYYLVDNNETDIFSKMIIDIIERKIDTLYIVGFVSEIFSNCYKIKWHKDCIGAKYDSYNYYQIIEKLKEYVEIIEI